MLSTIPRCMKTSRNKKVACFTRLLCSFSTNRQIFDLSLDNFQHI